ncbi:MAG: TAXI family TRAP transporter solute-binding subunit [Stellaceae bacterium]
MAGTVNNSIVAVLSIVAALVGWGPSASAARYAAPPAAIAVNRGVVELETGRASGISVRIAEDLANVIDDGATRRVLPVVGKGALQNISDLDLLHGVDMAILQDDVLNYARQQNLFPGIENRISYIAKLYNEEFHLLARRDIKTVADLANQKVNVDLRGAGTEITADRLFGLLHIPIVATNDDQEAALEKLRRGEIAAVAFVAGKPAPLFQGLDRRDGLHFLAIPVGPAVTGVYVPTSLTAADYPGLISADQPVDTVAIGAVLAVANLQPDSERYRNVVNFVDAFFTGFQSLLTPGHDPKWREVNIAAELPGWRRFPPAADWLARNTQVSAAPSEQDLKAIFARFIDQRQQASGGTPLTQQQKDQLFGQFEQWQKGQAH